MDESGGRGQPRSGNEESAERHAGPPARATDPTPADEQSTDVRRFTSTSDDDAPAATPPTRPDDRPSEQTPAPAADEPPGADRPAARPVPPAPGQSPAPTTDGPPEAAPQEHPDHAETPAGGEDAGGPPSEAAAHGDRPAADALRKAAARGEGDGSRPSEAAHPDGPEVDAHGEHDGTGRSEAAAHPDGPEPDTHGRHDDSSRSEPPAHPDRPEADALRKAPAPGDHHGGSRPPEGDAHPDRAYATGPHTDSAAGKPEASSRHATPGTGDRHLAHSADGKGPAPQRPEPRGGLLMGRPFGVPVYVAPSWFLVAALITWVFGGQLERVLPELGAARYLVSLFFAVAFYASVLVHELAHTVAALRFKLPVRRIQLQFFGGVSEIEKEAETPGREFVLAFVGPLLSLVLAGVFYAALQTVEPGTVPGVLLAGLMLSNLIVAAFNLLPGLPLDGGRMLRAVVWKITGKPMTGTVAAAWVGRALAVSVLIGLPLLTQSGALGTDAVDNVGMDTVLDALLAAILAAIIWTGAGNSLRMARLREHLPELQARALTRRAVPVETHTPLSEALRRANAAGARALVVVDAHGNPVSLVREAAIVGVPEHRRPWVAVSGLAQDLTDGMRVSAELSGEELLEALRATPATEYLVVEETGEIYGVLSAADVERAFVKAMARPS
ncbi:site-2 protease family protein [Streptomyces afghaniensis]|uniref:site-2 protease family protein n=1 Tax=Streptomyces afghaniensis TaxID=66865 RepID=UPI0027876B95|nr:site-2 protease family protein [Streptomyces afghaniensis]MDQ1020830.1 Zn-dependent protease [Streptomyces afghaniensis]